MRSSAILSISVLVLQTLLVGSQESTAGGYEETTDQQTTGNTIDENDTVTNQDVGDAGHSEESVVTGFSTSCEFPGCEECFYEGEEETCTRCNEWYRLDDGRCRVSYELITRSASENEAQQAIRDACTEMGDPAAEYCPPITFNVVKKRIAMQFYPKSQSRVDETGNVLPGTCVDTHVCHPHGFDFYLNSHAAVAGTSHPTLYSVLADDVGFDPDELQKLTYWMCHLFCRCARSVSYCPPAYYAHHAADMGKRLLTNKSKDTEYAIHEDIQDSMFFV